MINVQEEKRKLMITQKEFLDKIKNNIPFAFLRFCDGEMRIILTQRKVDQRGIMAGFYFDPNNNIDKIISAQLYAALKFKDDNYYIYIPYRRVMADDASRKRNPCIIKGSKMITQDQKYILDYADPWGLDYELTFSFIDNIFDVIREKKVTWICNERINEVNVNLPFKNIIKIKEDCWRIQYRELLTTFIDLILNTTSEIFLISAGALSEILIFYAWVLNKRNIYIDIGSLFDPFFLGGTRSYYRKPDIMKKYQERQHIFGLKK